MRRSVLIVLMALFMLVACNNDPAPMNQNPDGDWTKNIQWQGELASFPQNPGDGYAFYNIQDGYSYVYIGSQGWTPIAKSGLGLSWLGEKADFPLSPKYGEAFFHSTLGNSYVFDGVEWKLLAKSGKNGSSGILSWMGDLASAPSNPTDGTAYHNTIDGKSYFFSHSQWNVLTVDGAGMIWIGELTSAPSNPAVNTAYFNTSTNTAYIWDGTEWSTLAVSSSVNYSLSIQWKGNYSSAPISPSVGWMYYNTTQGRSYIWDGSCWEVVASDGVSPVGFLITWKGSLSSAPSNPQQGWCYYNSNENCSYIYDGAGWKLMVRGQASAGMHTASGGKLEVRIDGNILPYSGSTHQYTIEYDSSHESVTKTITITNTGFETVFFSDEGPIAYSSNTNDAWYYSESEFDLSGVPSLLNPGEGFSFQITFNPSRMVYSYFYLYNTTLHNPLVISFVQSNSSFISSSNSQSQSQLQYLRIDEDMYAPSRCHQISSYTYNMSQRGERALDFSVCESNKDGQTAELSLYSLSGCAPVLFKGDPFIWIDGKDAEDFVLQARTTSNLKLMNGASETILIQFKPKTTGEKEAILHVLSDYEGCEELEIPLNGKCVESVNAFDTLGYTIIETNNAIGEYSNTAFMTQDGQSGCYIISRRGETLDVYHVDSLGKTSKIKSFGSDISYIYYASYSDGKLSIYTYGSGYYIYILDVSSLKYTTTAYSSGIISSLQNPSIAGNTYEYGASYADYTVGFNRIRGYDIKMDIFNGENELKGSINSISSSSYINALCVSDCYLYYCDDHCVRRYNLDDLMSGII